MADQQELAVRTAIGATGNRLLRQVLTENVVLAASGGLAGVAVAYFGVAVLRRDLPSQLGTRRARHHVHGPG